MQWRMQGTASGVLGQAVLIASLSAAVWAVYYPSLGHGPRADQWCFLLDTVDQDQFVPLLAHTYSYNRTRLVSPGDYHLFRPVLFALLSGEKALFGNNFALWQATGILLHCLVMYLLLRLMFRIHDLTSPEAATEGAERWLSQWRILRAVCFALVLYFGLNCAVVEMVIWAHINGYILFVLFVLGSMLLLIEGIADLEASSKKRVLLLGAGWLLILLSAFTYEIGQFYAVIAGALVAVALYRKGQARRSIIVFTAFLGIFIIYRLANSLDQLAHADCTPDVEIATILEKMASSATLTHAGRYALYIAVQPFFPSSVDWSFSSRLVIPEPTVARWIDWADSPMLIASYVTLGGMAILTLIGLLRLLAAEHRRIGLLAALLAFSLFALHLAITVVGRMNLRPGPGVLSNNSYYPYIPLLFLILGMSAIWAFVASSRAVTPALLGNSLGVLVIGALLVLSIVSGVKVHEMNAKGRDDFAGFTRRIAEVERFIRQHSGRADFSLAFDRDSCQVLGTQHGVPVSTILFKRHINSSRPKYVICFPGGFPSAMMYEQWRASYARQGSLCPELIAVGSSYNFYRVEEWYYGVLHWDGCYDPARCDHAYLIKALTLEEAQKQQWVKLAEQDADIRAGRFIPPEMGVVLLEEGYKGFNLVGCTSKVYAIPRGEGAFDLSKISHHGYSRAYVGSTSAEVKSQIDQDGPYTGL